MLNALATYQQHFLEKKVGKCLFKKSFFLHHVCIYAYEFAANVSMLVNLPLAFGPVPTAFSVLLPAF